MYPPQSVDMTAMTHFVFGRVAPGGGSLDGAAGGVVPGGGNSHDAGLSPDGVRSVEDYLIRREIVEVPFDYPRDESLHESPLFSMDALADLIDADAVGFFQRRLGIDPAGERFHQTIVLLAQHVQPERLPRIQHRRDRAARRDGE